MYWYLQVLQKYAVFEGRARRKEYWMFFLINLIVSLLLALIDGAVIAARGESGMLGLHFFYSLAVAIPGIAVTVRRLHDTGKSGYWFFISFVPLLGALILLYFTVLDSDSGTNAYGENPKY